MNPYEFYRIQQQRSKLMRQSDSKLTIEGRGAVSVEPDIAIITLGVVTEGEDIETVQLKNEKAMHNVVHAIREYGVRSEDIQTIQYDIYPKHDFIEGIQTLRGYEVSNVIEIKLRDLNKDDDVIRSAVGAGANIQLGVEFTLTDPEPYYSTALNQALINGRQKAEEMAETLGVNLIPTPESVIEKGTYMDTIKAGRLSTVKENYFIQTGAISVSASIIAIYRFGE